MAAILTLTLALTLTLTLALTLTLTLTAGCEIYEAANSRAPQLSSHLG